MNRNRKLLCWIGSIMLSLSQAEIVPESIARFTVGEDSLAEETLLSRGQYPIFGSEIGARFIFHRQSTLWALLNLDSPSSGCVSPSNMRAARSNLSLGGRMIVDPSLLVGAYIQGETLRPFVEEDVGTLMEALLSPVHANAGYSVGLGVDGMFLHPTTKGLYPLQVALSAHYTLSDPNKSLYQTLIAYDKAGANLKVTVEYSKWWKYFAMGHYHYHDGKISTKPDIQHNTGTALGFEYRFNTYVSLVLQGEWSVYAGYYGRVMLHLNGLGSQAPTNRSLQSYLKTESPRQMAPILFVEELHNTPGAAPAEESMTPVFPYGLSKQYTASSSIGGTVHGKAPSHYAPSRAKPSSEVGSYASTRRSRPTISRNAASHRLLRLFSGSGVQKNRRASSYTNESALLSPQANERVSGWLGNVNTPTVVEDDAFTITSDATLVNSSSSETIVQTRINTFLGRIPDFEIAIAEAMKAKRGTDYPEHLIDQLVKPMDAIVAALPSSQSKQIIKAQKQAHKRIFSILNALTGKEKIHGMPHLSSRTIKSIATLEKHYKALDDEYESENSDSESSDTDTRGRNTTSKYTTTSTLSKVRNQSTKGKNRSRSKHPTEEQSHRDSRRAVSRAPSVGGWRRATSRVREREDSTERSSQAKSGIVASSSKRLDWGNMFNAIIQDDSPKGSSQVKPSHTDSDARSSSKHPEGRRRNSSRAPIADRKRSSSKARVRDDSSDRDREQVPSSKVQSSKRAEGRRRDSSHAPASDRKRSKSKARVRDDSSDRDRKQAMGSSRTTKTGGWGDDFARLVREESPKRSSQTKHDRTDSGVGSSHQHSERKRESSRAPEKARRSSGKGEYRSVKKETDSDGDKKKMEKPTVSFPAEVKDNQEEDNFKTPRDVTPYGEREEDGEQPLRFMEAEAQEHGFDIDNLADIRVRDTQQALSKAQRDAKKSWEIMHRKLSTLPYLKNVPNEEWNSVKPKVKALRQKVETTKEFKKWSQRLIEVNERKRNQGYTLTYTDCVRFLRKHPNLLTEDEDKKCLHEKIVPALTLHIVEDDKQSIKPELADIHQQAFSHKKPDTTAKVYYEIIQNAAEDILTDAEHKELLDLTFAILMRIPHDREFLQAKKYAVKQSETARAAAVKQIMDIKPE